MRDAAETLYLKVIDEAKSFQTECIQKHLQEFWDHGTEATETKSVPIGTVIGVRVELVLTYEIRRRDVLDQPDIKWIKRQDMS